LLRSFRRARQRSETALSYAAFAFISFAAFGVRLSGSGQQPFVAGGKQITDQSGRNTVCEDRQLGGQANNSFALPVLTRPDDRFCSPLGTYGLARQRGRA